MFGANCATNKRKKLKHTLGGLSSNFSWEIISQEITENINDDNIWDSTTSQRKVLSPET